MRRVIGSLLLVVGIAGCKNQNGGTISNPFLTPDRVPPPSTRVLAPGTAQPYYPGDPVPGAAAAAGAPVVGTPMMGAPGTTPTYTPAPMTGYPATGSPALTTPPGGWTYPPQSSTGAPGGFNGDSVSVPADQQGLRFAAPSSIDQGTPAPGITTPQTPNLNAIALAPANARLPIQSLLPLHGAAESAPSQLLSAREVTAAEYLAPPGGSAGVQLASAQASRDGFRAQGSQSSADASPNPAFRPPSIRREATPAADDATRFAAGENYDALRGQLEYWPVSGEWSLRYLAEGSPADALGGRVMIDNPQVLANLQPGEYVTVRGQLFSKASETGGAQAMYRVSGVQRQRP